MPEWLPAMRAASETLHSVSSLYTIFSSSTISNMTKGLLCVHSLHMFAPIPSPFIHWPFCNQSTFWSFLVTVTVSRPPRQSLVRKRKCGKLCDTRPPVTFPAAVQLNYICDYTQLHNLPWEFARVVDTRGPFCRCVCSATQTGRPLSEFIRVRLQQNKDRRT